MVAIVLFGSGVVMVVSVVAIVLFGGCGCGVLVKLTVVLLVMWVVGVGFLVGCYCGGSSDGGDGDSSGGSSSNSGDRPVIVVADLYELCKRYVH